MANVQTVYTLDEIVLAADKIFKAEKYNATFVKAALKLSGKTSFTQAEAIKIVNDFANGSEKDKATATITTKTERFSFDEIISASPILFKGKGYTPSLVRAALDKNKSYTKAEAMDAVNSFAGKVIRN